MMSSDPHSRASNVVFVDQELQVCSTSGGHGVTSNRPLPPAPHSIPRHSSILCFSGSNLLEPCHLPHYHRRDLPPRSRPLLTSAGCQCRLHFSRAGGCRLCQVQCRQSEQNFYFVRFSFCYTWYEEAIAHVVHLCGCCRAEEQWKSERLQLWISL